MSELTIVVPVSAAPDAGDLALATREPLDGRRLVVIDNGKPRAADLLGAIARGLAARHGLASTEIFTKQGASQPIGAEDVRHLTAVGDVFLTGLGDCGGCSACSLQDALLMERAGRPATVVISEPFQGRIAAQAAALGAPGYPVMVVPHPVASRPVDQLTALADRLVDGVAAYLGRPLDAAPGTTT